MSLEQKIEENTAAVVALTKMLASAKVAVPTAGSTTTETAAAPKKGPGRPPKEKPAPDNDDGLGLGGDDDGLGLGGEEEERAYTYDDLKKLMTELRDTGGANANIQACKDVLKKFKIANFKEFEEREDEFNAFADHVRQKIAAAKKG
jgi:hypothetical protein